MNIFNEIEYEDDVEADPSILDSIDSLDDYEDTSVAPVVEETEEGYTSGTSFLDNEEPTKENYDKKRRIYRGLFVSKSGKSINADVNGAYQIMKKVVPDAFSEGIEGVGLHPVRHYIS